MRCCFNSISYQLVFIEYDFQGTVLAVFRPQTHNIYHTRLWHEWLNSRTLYYSIIYINVKQRISAFFKYSQFKSELKTNYLFDVFGKVTCVLALGMTLGLWVKSRDWDYVCSAHSCHHSSHAHVMLTFDKQEMYFLFEMTICVRQYSKHVTIY